jgi:hypothetical protein
MPRCSRCNSDIGLLGRLSYNPKTGRCGQCDKEANASLSRFRNEFLSACHDGVLSGDEWSRLTAGTSRDLINLSEALAFVRGDALNFLERVLTFAYADGEIAEYEEKNIRYLLRILEIPENLAQPMLHRMSRLKFLSEIRKGNLPVVRASVHLDSDETCHMEMEATFHKVNAKSISYIQGKFVATNKRLHFLSPTGGAEILWKKIMRIQRDSAGLYLELATKKGNGYYDARDSVLAEAVIDTLVRKSKRQLITSQDSASRHIPQHVKIAVWQRDQGKCVQCGAGDYLEFDHIIPFGQGGASSEGNLQLLCRRCNLSKGGRL